MSHHRGHDTVSSECHRARLSSAPPNTTSQKHQTPISTLSIPKTHSSPPTTLHLQPISCAASNTSHCGGGAGGGACAAGGCASRTMRWIVVAAAWKMLTRLRVSSPRNLPQRRWKGAAVGSLILSIKLPMEESLAKFPVNKPAGMDSTPYELVRIYYLRMRSPDLSRARRRTRAIANDPHTSTPHSGARRVFIRASAPRREERNEPSRGGDVF